MASGNRLMPTDLEMIAYLKLKTESHNLWIPTWVVHQVEFWKYGPQKLAKDFPPASDGSWYFVFTWPIRSPVFYDGHGWKELDIPASEKFVYNQGNPAAYKYQIQMVDDNNQEWRMCVYRAVDPVDRKLRNERLAKMYKLTPDIINRASKRQKREAYMPPVKFMPTHEDACAYLKLKMESLSLSIPVWVVHEFDFRKYRPQQLAETFEAAKDQGQTWYFVSPKRPLWSEWAVDWKRLDIPSPELVIYRFKRPVGLRLECEFLDENNQKWQLCFYLSFNLHAKEKREYGPGAFGKLKRIEEEERCFPGNKTIDIKECKKETLT